MEMVSDLSTILDMAIDTKEVFSGRVFIGLGQLGRTIRCNDATCASGRSDKGPISQVQLVGKNEITLKSNVPLNLPAAGFFNLAGGKLTAGNMIYDVPAESGYGQITDFKVALDDGQISAGNTKLRFGPSTKIEIQNVDISKDQKSVSFSGGMFDAQLGPDTTINLTTSGDRSSYVELIRAHAVFYELDIRLSQDDRHIRFRNGTLDHTQIAGAVLAFSTRNALSMGLTSFSMSFGCDGCPGFSWASGGKNLIIGSITDLSAVLRPGGKFAVTDSGGAVEVARGEVRADRLSIDTRDAVTPITGTLNYAQIVIENQTLALDDATSIKSASVTLTSSKIVFEKGDQYPSGTLRLVGTVAQVSGGAFGGINFSSANIAASLKREAPAPSKPKQLEIADGNISGQIDISAGSAHGEINASITDLNYGDGRGHAWLAMDITGVSYVLKTPGAHYPDDPDSSPYAELKSIEIPLSLDEQLSVPKQELKAKGGKWDTDPIIRGFKLNTHINDQELIYARVKVLTDKCISKLTLHDAGYSITGRLQLTLGTNYFPAQN